MLVSSVTLLVIGALVLLCASPMSPPAPPSSRGNGRRKFGSAVAVLAIGASLLGVIALFVNHEIVERKAQATQAQTAILQQRKVKQAIAGLAASSGAIADWKSDICKSSYASPVLTSELQDALMRTGNRPVLITGLLGDARRDQNGQQFISISAYVPCRNTKLQVELLATPEDAREVLARRSESLQYYAAIAEVTSVEKKDDDDDSIFLVRGQCLNLLFTGFDGMSIDMDQSLKERTQDTGEHDHSSTLVTVLAVMAGLWAIVVVGAAVVTLVRRIASSMLVRRQGSKAGDNSLTGP